MVRSRSATAIALVCLGCSSAEQSNSPASSGGAGASSGGAENGGSGATGATGGTAGARGIDAGAVELEVEPGYYLSLDADILPIEPVGEIALTLAPQGGHYLFVSARARPVTSEEVEVKVQFFEPGSEDVLREEIRVGPVSPSPAATGWVEPDPLARTGIAHFGACPVDNPPGLPFQTLDVKVTITEQEPGGLTGSARLPVHIVCTQATPTEQAFCECECKIPYDPGECF